VRSLPPDIRSDALGEIDARDWTAAKEPYANPMLGKLNNYPPGVRDAILKMTVSSCST
jgi:hypothetical protein